MRNTLLAVSFALLGALVFLCALPAGRANPTGPVVTGGAHPWLDFTGSMTPFQTITLTTVPADRVFVMTTLCSYDATNNGTKLDVLEGTTLKVEGSGYVAYCRGTGPRVMSRGAGRVTFQPGSEVNLRYFPNSVSDPNDDYYVEGYLAHP